MTKAVKERFYPVAMTVTGSDSGGGAGVAADLRTFNAIGVFGCCAVTAVTAANPAAVRRIDAVPAAGITAQIDAVMENIAVNFCKTGMLYDAETVSAVADAVEKYQLKLVCDPILRSDSGTGLMQNGTLEALKNRLLPLASWLTAGIAEAETLLGKKISGTDGMLAAAGELSEQYHCAVLLRGNPDTPKRCTDVIVRDGRRFTLTTPYLEVPPFAVHGAGCTMSAALTAFLALDMQWKQALCESRAFVYGSLAQTVNIGKKISAMYPPVEDSIQLVKLTEAE